MFHIFKLSTHHDDSNGKFFAHLSLLLGFSNAIFWATLPGLVSKYSHDQVSFTAFFVIIAVISLLGALLSTVIFKHFSRVDVFRVCLILYTFVFAALMFSNSFISLVILEAMRSFLNVLLWVAIALFIRDFSAKTELGRSEGRFFLFVNTGFILGFFASSIITMFFDVHHVFFVSSIVSLFALIYFSYNHIKFKEFHIHDAKESTTLRELFSNIKQYFAKKNHIKAYATTFGLYYWLALSAIYIPIFIIGSGMETHIVGYVLGAGILPLIFMEEWAGSLSDKKGMKFFLMSGFILLGLACFFLGLGLGPILMISIMVLSNIGAGIIEPIQEKYFFTVIDKTDENKYYGVRLTAQPLAGIVAPAIAGISFLFFEKNAIWLSAAIVMIIMVFVSLSIKK